MIPISASLPSAITYPLISPTNAPQSWADVGKSLIKIAEAIRLLEPTVLERATATGLTPERARILNVGNVHYATGRRSITPSVYLSGAEVGALGRLG